MTPRTGPSLAVVANPVGAADESAILRSLLNERGLAVNWFDTAENDAGVGQTEEAIDNGADLIIACGGDGTVRSCLQAAAGTAAAVGVIPAGTGNLLARNLEIPLDVAEAFDVILTGRVRSMDLGYVNDEAFAVMAGIGLDARIMRDTDRESKERFGTAAYLATTVRHLDDHLFTASIQTDGGQEWSGGAASILVANHGKLQGGVSLFPDASAHDGKLDILAASASTLSDWARAAVAVLSDESSRGPIERLTGSEITVTTVQSVPYQLDGEERDPVRSATFTVRRDAVSVVVPTGDQS